MTIQSLHEHIARSEREKLWGRKLATSICKDLDAALRKKDIRYTRGRLTGSTLSVVQEDIKDGKSVLRGLYIGDSPIYIIDITTREMLEYRWGLVDGARTVISPMKGAGHVVRTFKKHFDPSHKILTLVCSDGAADVRILAPLAIEEIALRDPANAARNIIEAAIQQGTRDNATVCQMFSGALEPLATYHPSNCGRRSGRLS